MRLTHVTTTGDDATYTVEMSKAEYNLLKIIQHESAKLPKEEWESIRAYAPFPYTALLGALVTLIEGYVYARAVTDK